MPAHDTLADLLLLVVCCLPLALGLRRIGQSTIVGYLLTGLIIGPGGLALIPKASIESLAGIGVSLLLFEVGIEPSLERIAETRRIAVGGGTPVAEGALPVGVALAKAAGLLAVLFVGSRYLIDRFRYHVARARSP